MTIKKYGHGFGRAFGKRSGWTNYDSDQSRRHGLAALGVSTGRKSKIDYSGYAGIGNIKKVTTTKYLSDQFEFTFEPIEDSVIVKELPDGYEVKYLVRDDDALSPDEDNDESLFLVHYHSDFDIERDSIITKDDTRDWYQGKKIPQQKEYWLVPVEAYIHSGVSLAVGDRGNFPDRRWDVSHVGIALASKKEFGTKEQAEKSVNGLLERWNQYLSGDVYGMVAEKYDKNKKQIDQSSVWGLSGYKYANEELKSYGYENMSQSSPSGQKNITDYARKDWKKIGYGAWIHNNGRTQVGIVAWGSKDNKILYSPRYAILERGGGARGIAIKRGGFTEEKALKIVSEYMEEN